MALFQIHRRSHCQPCQRGAVQRFVHHIAEKAMRKQLRYRQANAIDCNAVADFGSLKTVSA